MNYWFYIFFSAVDLICTIRLSMTNSLKELNPIANWILSTAGTIGLAGYKMFIITIIIGICLYISKTHPATSFRVMFFANTLGLLVTVYQIGLTIVF